jgi:hypothetical protein
MSFYYHFKNWQSLYHDKYFDEIFAGIDRIYQGDDEHFKFGDLTEAKRRVELIDDDFIRGHYRELIRLIEDNPNVEISCG